MSWPPYFSRQGAALIATVALLANNPIHAQPAQAVRPELAAPLSIARDLLQRQKWTEALAQLALADKAGAVKPDEVYLLERLRAAAATGAGDQRQVANSLSLALATGQAPVAEQPGLREALAAALYGLKDWPAATLAATEALKREPANTRVGLMLAQSRYLSQDFIGAASSLETLLLQQPAGVAPAQAQLELLAGSYNKLKNTRAYMGVLERLLTFYPSKNYWADLLANLENQPGFAPELAIDVLRLQFTVGAMTEASEFVDLAQKALKAGFPTEALKVLEAASAAKMLDSGPGSEAHRRLMAQVRQLAAADLNAAVQPAPSDPNQLFSAGYNRVLQNDNLGGIAQMEQAVRMPGLKRVQHAQLRLGEAALTANNKVRALEAFKRVDATDGAADLARLWVLHATRP